MKQNVTESFAVKTDEEPPRAPHNIEVEQAVLGAVLVKNEVLDDIAELISGMHFYDPLHGRIFDYCVKKHHAGQLADYNTLRSYFQDEPPIGTMTVPQYLGRLAACATTTMNAVSYAQTIKNLSMKRSLIIFGEDLCDSAYHADIDVDASDIIQDAEATLYQLAENGLTRSTDLKFSSAVQSTMAIVVKASKSEDGISGLRTGYTDLDNKTGGSHKSDLNILAARPSMGKTSLITNMAKYQAYNNIPVGFFSLEMSKEQLTLRMISDECEVPSNDLRNGRATDEQVRTALQAGDKLSEMPLYIDDTGGLSISQLAVRARRLKRMYGIETIYIDYLQLMQGDGRYSGQRVQEITQITTGLKALAKELDISIWALSQLSRQVENRDDKRPMLSDLRDSGSIEQDADNVFFLYRDEYYLEREKPNENNSDEVFEHEMALQKVRNRAELIIGKQRNGPLATIKLGFQKNLMRFFNLSEREVAA